MLQQAILGHENLGFVYDLSIPDNPVSNFDTKNKKIVWSLNISAYRVTKFLPLHLYVITLYLMIVDIRLEIKMPRCVKF